MTCHFRLTAIGLVAAWACCAQTAQVNGTVVDARGGEALARVEVQLAGTAYRTSSDSQGKFQIGGIQAGDYVLNVSTIGYRLTKKPFHLDAGETKQFEVILSPGTLTQTDSVDVKAGPFEVPVQNGTPPLVLAGTDVTNLASVLADDPLRAVQGLPGVASNDDFEAKFSLRGADFDRTGIYLDGILLHSPMHTIESTTPTGSESAFNGGMVETLALYEADMPAQFSDRSAGALEVLSRDGGRDAIAFRAEASFSNAGVTVEGPLDKAKRGSWLVSARKSYMQYIIDRVMTSADNSLVFGLEDVQARLTYDLTPHNYVSLDVLESYTNLDRSSKQATLGINSLMLAGYNFTLAKAGWRYTPNEKFIVNTRAAWMREKFDDQNSKGMLLQQGHYGEWVGNQTASWVQSPNATFDAGWNVREIRDQGTNNQFQSNLTARLLEAYRGNSTRGGGYLSESWSVAGGMVRFTAGGRGDHDSLSGRTEWSPMASAAVNATKSTRVSMAWGEYTQFPEVAQLGSTLGNVHLLPARTIQVSGAIEQRIGERTRVRAEFYDRTDRDMIFQSWYEPRLINGKVFVPPLYPLYYNSLRGYSRGFQIFLQRVSANRLSGWISYAYGRTNDHDGVANVYFPSDWDQRHSFNLYAAYRLRPSINLSLRSVIGSGFPIPGFLTKAGSNYYLSAARNTARLGTYERTDFRINKNWTHVKWKTTLYGEVVNITDRSNYRYDSFNGYNVTTHQASITLDKLFPILPSVGIVVER